MYERCNLVHVDPTCYTEVARFPEWIEAMKAEIDVIERNGTWKLTELPEAKKAIGVKPFVKHLEVFGSLCYLHVPSIKRGKLDERAEKGVFVRYAAESKGYIIYSLSRMKIDK